MNNSDNIIPISTPDSNHNQLSDTQLTITPDNTESKKLDKHGKPIAPPILNAIGVKPAESRLLEYLRIIALIVLIIYIIYMIYDDYMDDLEREEAMKSLLKSDTDFYSKLAHMDSDLRNKYLDAVKTSLGDNSTNKSTLCKAIRNGMLAGTLSEFIISGSQAKVMGTIGRTVIYSCISAFS
jgi:hypothetical protein